MVDLHTHSTASDGTMTPAQLAKHAWELGITAFALTDHDTVAGIEPAIAAANRYDITVIPGIEIEVNVPEEDAIPGTCHILGLGLTSWRSELQASLATLSGQRDQRNRTIITRMQHAGITVDYDDVRAYAGDGVVGRPHIARYMVDQRLAKDEVHAFQEYLGEFGAFFVPRDLPSLDLGLQIIHKAGGMAVLAHPQTLRVSWNGLVDRLVRWKRLGLDGIEAFHSNIRHGHARRIAELASDLGLVVSAGSDFHGLQRKDRKLGRTTGGLKIADSFARPFLRNMKPEW